MDDAASRSPENGDPESAARALPRARLRPPQVRALPRERLLRSLATAPGHRVVLVTGPAGSGKTTLLAQLAESARGPTAWYHLDAGDGREQALLRHLGEALAPVVPGLAAGGDAWASADAAAAALDAAAVSGPPVVLALDDLHVVADSPGEAALGRLVELTPPWLVLAATCRQAPRWNLSRLRVSGALVEIGHDDLRFRSWEVERLFADVYGEPLPPADLARLARGLEGWAAGLQLFHLATRGKHASERRRAVAALPARSQLIRDYLSGNVLDELPDDLRAFLIDTSVLGRLTPTVCDRLRDRSDSRRLLTDLEAQQVFVTRLDEDDLAFRYHEVFRAYLENRLVERDGEAQAKEWSRLAAALLEDEGRSLSDALRAYCWAGDWMAVGRILEVGGSALADDASWLDWLPAGLLADDPWVMIATARRAGATGRFAAALDLYQRVEGLGAGAAPRDVARRERAVVTAWLDPAAPPPPGWSGRLRSVLRARPAPRPPVGTTVTIRVHVAGDDPGAPTVGAITTASGFTADGDASDGRAPAAAPGVPGGPGESLVDAVGAVLAGQLGVGTERLTALADDPDVPLAIAAGARLASLVATALAGRPVSGEQEDLAELVELVDMPWLAALALAAGGLAGGAAAERAVDVAVERDAHGDPWGALAARLCAGLGTLLAGGRPVAELDDVVVRAARLEATVLECWARAWLATALARSGDGQAAAVAAEAERLAARAEVPGAEVWALTVRAQLAGGDEGAGLAARAESIRRQWAVDVPVPALTDAPVHPADVAGEAPAAPVAPRPERTAAGPGLRVRCLGGFRLELDGNPVDVAAVKPRARAALHLLAAYGGRPVHTETLVDALWPDMDAAAGKRNVQVAVSSLRRLLDDHRPGASALVRRDGQAYALALPDVSCSDVAVFAAACAEVRAAARASNGDAVLDAGDRALVAYGGDLLPEEGPADWAVDLRRSLAADATGVALTVADQAIGLGYFDVAAIACARGLEIDRYHDGLWRLLIDAQARGGDVAAAARTQDRYHEVLRELGLDADTSVDVLTPSSDVAPASDQALA